VSSQILQNYTITAMWYGVWAKMPYHTTFVNSTWCGYCSACKCRVIRWYEFGWDKIYIEITAFDEVYNFAVQIFSIWSHLEVGKNDILPRCGYRKLRFG
jgi:hypothetical protein